MCSFIKRRFSRKCEVIVKSSQYATDTKEKKENFWGKLTTDIKVINCK